MGTVATINATIANGASLSDAVKIGDSEVNDGSRAPADFRLFGIVMPSAWTAASLTFQVSADGTTYQDLYFNGSAVEIAIAGGAVASGSLTIDPAIFSCWPYVKVRSGKSGTPVNQAAARTVQLVLRAG